jgi:hypothetical protein
MEARKEATRIETDAIGDGVQEAIESVRMVASTDVV